MYTFSIRNRPSPMSEPQQVPTLYSALSSLALIVLLSSVRYSANATRTDSRTPPLWQIVSPLLRSPPLLSSLLSPLSSLLFFSLCSHPCLFLLRLPLGLTPVRLPVLNLHAKHFPLYSAEWSGIVNFVCGETTKKTDSSCLRHHSVISIFGEESIGKSTFAARVAAELAALYPAGT